jgi:hypothetical protein
VGLVLSIQRIMETVFMESLVHYVPDPEEEDVSNFCEVKNLLLPGLRSFCSALRVCEEVRTPMRIDVLLVSIPMHMNWDFFF